MYLHIGNDTVVSFDDIVGIFDIDTASISRLTREYLKESAFKEIISVTNELPKSFIVCRSHSLNKRNHDKNKFKIYISQISTSTLLKRTAVPYQYAKDDD